ncbi:ribosome biogenesis factor YjgA [Paraglaciecola aquimarina]|uniref:Dual-action ribosomal maturation protein DarP n=1 Tax=Paraglaciecola aquimarina TaxID=1235557 RepID=A0ABU3SSV8_9ALTE|nr:ribosome biogenesis factor YjgA [Paraglaciecola aquimarina]MDU0353102.1 ribosome biogenesis factor YjgA [Paraglaciecola aquimarina]
MVASRKNNQTENSFDIEEEVEFLSKTQIKAQAEELQKLGTSLVHLGPSALAKIPMDAELLEAVMLARKILRKKEGYRRQLQLIGKLMRSRDVTPIEQALLTIKSSHKKATNAFHKIEELRDKIITEGDSKIESTLVEYPLLDRQKLRQLFRQAQKQQADNKAPKASREMFKYLKDVIIG